MPIGGVSDPVIVAILVTIGIFMVYVFPKLLAKKSLINYNNFDVRNTNAFYHFAGISGPGYHNLQIKERPTYYANGRYSIQLEGLPKPLNDVNLNPFDGDCNVKIKLAANTFFGERIDVLCNIDANGHKSPWDSVYVENWDRYVDRLKDSSKHKILKEVLENKELADEIKGQQPLGAVNNTPFNE